MLPHKRNIRDHTSEFLNDMQHKKYIKEIKLKTPHTNGTNRKKLIKNSLTNKIFNGDPQRENFKYLQQLIKEHEQHQQEIRNEQYESIIEKLTEIRRNKANLLEAIEKLSDIFSGDIEKNPPPGVCIQTNKGTIICTPATSQQLEEPNFQYNFVNFHTEPLLEFPEQKKESSSGGDKECNCVCQNKPTTQTKNEQYIIHVNKYSKSCTRVITKSTKECNCATKRKETSVNALTNQKVSSEEALIDSGANIHVTNNEESLTNKEQYSSKLSVANGTTASITAKGEWHLPTNSHNGTKIDDLVVKDVTHCSECPVNILSVSMLCKQGLTFHFGATESYFKYKGRRHIIKEVDGLYVINLNNIISHEEANTIIEETQNHNYYIGIKNPEVLNENRNKNPEVLNKNQNLKKLSENIVSYTYELWHKRFGHADKRRIKFLYDNGSVAGLNVDGKFTHDAKCTCETCLIINNTKPHIGDIRKHPDMVSRKGELIYSDLAGPYPPSIEGYRYVISFVDVYSRFSVCYPIHQKSDAAASLKKFNEFCNSHNIKISTIRTDQGGEYGGHNEQTFNTHNNENEDAYDNTFQETCTKLDIKSELMPAHRPELHSIVERWNRTVAKMANSMMYEARINFPLWSAAFCHANLIRNRLPVTGLGTLTPYEIFHGKRPQVDNLRIWGSYCYKLIPGMRKLPGLARRKKLIYVGETANRMGFRCFDPVTFKFTTEFEVIFDEEGLLNRHKQLHDYDNRRERLSKDPNDTMKDVNIKHEIYEEDFLNLRVGRSIFTDESTLQEIENSRSAPEAQPESEQIESAPEAQINNKNTKSSSINHSVETGGEEKQVSTKVINHETNNEEDLRISRTNKRNLDEQSNPKIEEESLLFGPLTSTKNSTNNKIASWDESDNKKPLRIVPRGHIEKLTKDTKNWIKEAIKEKYPIEVLQKNPKKLGSKSYNRYEAYKKAKTLCEIIETMQRKRENGISIKQAKDKALKDIEWDISRGYILFPEHENNINGSLSKGKRNEIENIAMICTQIETKHQFEKGDPPLSFATLMKELWKNNEHTVNFNQNEIEHIDQFAVQAIKEILNSDDKEPKYQEIANPNHPEHKEWMESVKRETDTLAERETWAMVPRKSLPYGKKPIKCKFVLKKKLNKDGTTQYKSRLVGCGYSMNPGEDYSIDETYAGVCSYSSMRFLLSLACQKNMILHQSDISGAYLESHLNKYIYMEPPPNMYKNGKPPTNENGEPLVCEVRRGLYGLKNAGFAWSQCFKEFMMKDKKYNMGFQEMTSESNMYRRKFILEGTEEEIIIGQYVDDCLIAGSSQKVIKWFLENMGKRFPINKKSSGTISEENPGLLLSMEVKYNQNKGILSFNQERAIEKLAQKLNIQDAAPRDLPIKDPDKLPKLTKPEVSQIEYLSIIGSCLHISQVSRPDCAFAVGVLARHSANPGNIHMKAALDLVKYIYATRRLYIKYERIKHERIESKNNISIYEGANTPKELTIEERLVESIPRIISGEPYQYCDADYAGDKHTRKSTSGWISFMNGGPISWASRLQKLCAQSSAEAEIYAVVDSAKEALHLKLLSEECEIRNPNKPLTIYEDNNSCIQMGHGLRGSKSAKHFEVRLRFLHEHIEEKNIEFNRINTKNQVADGLTKALPKETFLKFREEILS